MRAGLHRACEPLAVAAKHRGCAGVGHKQAGEFALIIALEELDASCARDDAQLVEPTAVVLVQPAPKSRQRRPGARISAMRARAAALRRQRREGETERDRPPEQALAGITRGCATNVNDPEATW